DVVAPGVGIVSAAPDAPNAYVRRQGTSMAAPHTAGVAALAVAATDGRATDATVQAAIVDTAVHPANATAPDDRYGHGVVDAPAAVAAAVEAAPPPDPEPTADTPNGNGTGSDGGDSGHDANDSGSVGPGETDGRVPGFGASVAVPALLSAALLAARRTDRR
ncbi:S8 family serine peptidase, partial [Halorubrum sp. CBA1125]|uniref:S8 family serine peptidase n=1 Tax=Halorubrum sp. CBA1125 TaxID=2668072 RepID=UPI0012E7EC62